MDANLLTRCEDVFLGVQLTEGFYTVRGEPLPAQREFPYQAVPIHDSAGNEGKFIPFNETDHVLRIKAEMGLQDVKFVTQAEYVG